jgi:methionyl-tRNA synthetase
MVGKDILRQHAVYWPIMLKACGVEMPKAVFAHGWWTMSGAKVSKSRGNAVDPLELVKKYGVDAFRYFLLREVTIGLDGAFSEDLLAERYTSDLANDFGNLWFRFASMLEKYFDKKIPETAGRATVQEEAFNLWDKMDKAMAVYDPKTALGSIWTVITMANQFIEEKKPWVLAKTAARKSELASVMTVLAETIAHVAVILLPFLPETSAQMLKRLELPIDLVFRRAEDFRRPLTRSGTRVERGAALFPRLDQEKVTK